MSLLIFSNSFAAIHNNLFRRWTLSSNYTIFCHFWQVVFLREKYGRHLVFWGGGIDTQRVLPFSSPEEIREQVKERIQVFGRDGGFVFNAIHNIQPMIPVENLVALFDAVNRDRCLR